MRERLGHSEMEQAEALEVQNALQDLSPEFALPMETAHPDPQRSCCIRSLQFPIFLCEPPATAGATSIGGSASITACAASSSL